MANRAPRRPCRCCGAFLAADNAADTCGICARGEPAFRVEPPIVPDSVWSLPDIRAALVRRHFGQVLRAYRSAFDPEVKQVDVGRWLGLTQGQVSRIERAPNPVYDLDKLERWARVLRIPQQLLWFTFSSDQSDADNDSADNDSLRPLARTVVGASLLGGVTATAPKKAESGNPEVATVREVTGTFRLLDNRYGGGHSRTAATNFLATTVEPLLRDHRLRGDTRADLFSAVAELHQLIGWMGYDTGHADVGRNHLRAALRLCQHVGNNALGAEMLAAMSHHAAFFGAPEAAVDLALASAQTAKTTGLAILRAESAVMEAHGLALQGDKGSCLAALRTAEQEFAASDGQDKPAWLGYFDSAYLAAKFAHVFRDLGQPRDAELFARRSLGMSDGYERGRLFNTALLASALADQRRVEEACASAVLAVTMGQTVRSVRTVAYLADVGRRLAPFRTSADVSRLYDRMIDAGVPVPPTSR